MEFHALKNEGRTNREVAEEARGSPGSGQRVAHG